MKFVVDTKTWLQGEGHYRSKLLRASDGKMCCLGFLALACGIPAENIKNKSSLAEIKYWQNLSVKLFVNNNLEEIEEVNDDERILSKEKRQTKLTELFSKIEIEIIFI